MTEDKQKKLAQTIAKLRALAEHPNTPDGERQNATAQISSLMEKYAIDELMVEAAMGNTVPDRIIKKEYPFKGVYFYADSVLVQGIAKAIGLKAIMSKSSNTAGVNYVVGFERDFQRFDVLYTSALLQRDRALNRYLTQQSAVWHRLTASEKYNARRSFMVGFASGLADKLEAASKKVHEEVVRERGSGAELVLVERKALVEKQFQQEFGRTTQARIKLVGSHTAGQRAGQAADIGGTGIGGSRGALPR